MLFSNKRIVLLLLFVVAGFTVPGFGQAKPGDGTDVQRLNVMSQKLTIMRRSLTSAASVLSDENKDDKSKKDDKKKTDTPLSRLLGLEKEASRLQGDVGSLHGKVDRAEKYEKSEVDSLEQAVSELQA